MTKFICTADIHLWLRKDVPEEWQITRYHQLFELLIELCMEHNASLIIAGDLFEKAKPALKEIQLAFEFFRALKTAKIKVYLISGNHCTIAKDLDTFQHLDMGKDKTIDVHYQPEVWTLQLREEKTTITFMNHCNLQYLERPVPWDYQHILVSHFRCTVNQFIQEEIDVQELMTPFDLCVAGDIHLPYRDGELWYTDAPVNKDFERKPETGVLLLVVNDGTHQLKRIETDLPKLIKVECTADDYVALTLDERHYYNIHVTGTPAQLKSLPELASNEKLVPIPVVDEALIVRAVAEDDVVDLPLEEDLIQYMQELAYPEEKVGQMISEFREV